MKIKLSIILLFSFYIFSGQEMVKGKVYIPLNDGNYQGVGGVNIFWKSTSIGVVSDDDGSYSIPISTETKELVFKILGYKEDIVEIIDSLNYDHFLTEQSDELDEVILLKRKNTIQKSYFKTMNIVSVSSDELLKAACCNVSESFETNPSIDVSFSNAITGVKEVKMLGLESPYLLITEENIPMVRGASQVFGLSFIPGSWVESMQVTKGVGSVVNGFESISGQVNIELNKPISDVPTYINIFRNSMGRNELNFHFNRMVNEKLSTGLFIHADHRKEKHDSNNDGFLDIPHVEGYNIFNRWQLTDLEKGVVSFFGIKFMKNEKEGGERFDTNSLSNKLWLSEIKTERFDATFKLGYVNPNIPYQSLGFQMAYSDHDQNSFFGVRNYDITHRSLYSNIIYNSIIGNTMNKIKTGINLTYDDYEELIDLDKNKTERIDRSIGGFFEYSYDNTTNFSLTAGLRYDSHNNLGSFFTPRLHLRFQPKEKTVMRFSLGSGRKSSNIYAENQEIFSTGRKIKVINSNGKFYGLNPEKALNYGLSFRQGFNLNSNDGDVTFDYYVTDFQNQIVVDWETEGELSFYNLNGKSYARSFQLEIDYQLTRKIKMKTAYKNYQVNKQYNSGLKQNPLTPKNRFFINLDYSSDPNDKGAFWKFDFTLNNVGKQRLPEHGGLSNFLGFSPSYTLFNSQVTKVFSEKFEIYLGGENLGNYTQKNPILDSENPFGTSFDGTLIYSPIVGSMIYAGIRLKL